MKSLSLFIAMLWSLSTFAINCGDTITSKTVLEEDLDCSSYQGFAALTLRGDAILQGRDHKIISPNTSVGIYAEGNDIRVRRTIIEVSESAIGVMAYNVSKMVVNNSDISNARIGVDYYTEDEFACDRLRISNSTLVNNTNAAKVNAPNCEYTPRFVNNDFSSSKGFALDLVSKKIRIVEKQGNNFYGSANGLLLSASERVTVAGIDLSDDQIAGTSVYVYSSNEVRLRNLTLGNTEEAIHIYDSSNIKIRKASISNTDIGIRVTNDQSDTDLLIARSDVSGDIALLVSGYGSAVFNQVELKNSVFDGSMIENY
ncbi:MAG: hypothetical protein CME65_02695 [Halobacteriovoraceae bacterium]|nr:hypothetical protein [Halobacteriovoraceae bacterium]|tara:strand:+ start:246 stop:1187 length:942 start_codon:yes stop_codon:yes gene_type:complete